MPRFSIRPLLLFVVLLLATPAQALLRPHDESGDTRLDVGINSQLTRYGTSYETVYTLNLQPAARLRLGSFELGTVLPVASGATSPTFCCRRILGNATGSVAYRPAGPTGHFWSLASASAPTSRFSYDGMHASSLAATAALGRDAGYYLFDTTTFRFGLGGEVSLGRGVSLGGSAGAHYWWQHAQPSDQLVAPLAAFAALELGGGFATRLTSRHLVLVVSDAGVPGHAIHELELAAGFQTAVHAVEVSVTAPLDDSRRSLGMLSAGVSYSRSF